LEKQQFLAIEPDRSFLAKPEFTQLNQQPEFLTVLLTGKVERRGGFSK
jgi:hypothetical protein